MANIKELAQAYDTYIASQQSKVRTLSIPTLLDHWKTLKMNQASSKSMDKNFMDTLITITASQEQEHTVNHYTFCTLPLNAEEILPKEVWGIILKQCEGDSTTLYNCYNTCKLWKNLLEDDKNTFLFPQVLSLISINLNKRLDPFDVLKCRLISKKWKNTVDNYADSTWPLDFKTFMITNRDWNGSLLNWNPIYWPCYLQLQNYFWNLDNIEAFLKKFSTFGGTSNPFVASFAHFQDISATLLSGIMFWEAICKKLLPTYGRYITTCRFGFSKYSDYSMELIHVIIVEAIKNMPCLKNITIRCKDYVLHDSSLAEFINGFAQGSSFPITRINLPKLLHVNVFKVGLETIECLLKPSVESLAIHFADRKDYPPISSVPTHPIVSIGTVQNSAIMLNFLDARNMKRLTVHVKNLQELADFTAVFKQTLEILEVDLLCDVDEECLNLRLQLPFLKTFKIAAPSKIVSFDFISDLAILEHLEIYLLPCSGNSSQFLSNIKTDFVLNIVDCYESLYESNIWNFLPSLRTVVIENKVRNQKWEYTRKD